MNKSWYERKIFVLFIFLSITLIFVFSSRNIELGNSVNSSYAIFSIKFQYYGMDASNIEKIITIPLEESISGMSDLVEFHSSINYGESITTAYFNKNINSKRVYLEIRNLVDNLYNQLPASVQKPHIYSADSEQNAVISIAIKGNKNFDSVTNYVNTSIKPKIESIDGIAEVIIIGETINEIIVEFDSEKMVKNNINPSSLASIIQDANVVSPSASFHNDKINQTISFATKINNLDEIKKLPVKIGEDYTSLEYLANINIKERDTEEIVRVNGEKVIAIQIISTYTGNSIKISSTVRNIFKDSQFSEDDYVFLFDNGLKMYNMIKNVLIALLESIICVVIIVPLFYKSRRIPILLIVLLPINILWTVSVLNIFKINIDQNILAGFTIAIGLTVDPFLIISEINDYSKSSLIFYTKIKSIVKSIIASCFTTLLVLIPLFFLDSIVPGVKKISLSIGIMLINSIIISVLFYPSLLFNKRKDINVISNKINVLTYKLAYSQIKIKVRSKKALFYVYLVLIIIPFVLFFVIGKNIYLEESESIIYATIEYAPEISSKVIDTDLQKIVPLVNNSKDINFIYTEARQGSSSFDVGFNEKEISRKEISNKINTLNKYLSNDAYIYVPEQDDNHNTKLHQIQISIIGDDIKICREYAKQIVNRSSKNPFVVQSVLNFKNPEIEIIINPNKDYLAQNKTSTQSFASNLRWFLFGPVVDKWLEGNKESDIRIIGENSRNITYFDLENLPVDLLNTSTRINNIGRIKKEQGIGKIYRLDGRRVAYCTLVIKANSTQNSIKVINSILENIKFDKGYGVLLPKELKFMNKNYNILLFSFFISVIGVILLLTGLTESLKKTLLIISIIPVSISLPLIIKFIFKLPLEMGDVVGMILVSGISVNNTIYIIESKKSNIYFKIREKIKSITVTSLSTILGAIPLLLSNTDKFAKDLSFFMVLGILASFVASVFMFSSVYDKFNCTAKRM